MGRPLAAAALLLLPLIAAARLPLGQVPPGKVFLVILPHHDDHTWEYGFGGLIAKFADAGYTGYYVRVTNDEKDGSHGWAENNIINQRETVEAIRYLGMKEVLSLNWRNDHTDSVPLNEMKAQLVLLIRQYRPDAVMAYHPWGHYDRNPDHRKSARAVNEAIWAAADARFFPEHRQLGLEPYRVPYRYYSQRSDYGLGYRPNVAFELNDSQMERKSKAYWMNRNVRLPLALPAQVRAELARQGLAIPELEGLNDEEAAKKLQEWRMYWIASKRGRENGVRYAEVFDFLDEFDDLPELKNYILQRSATQAEEVAGGRIPEAKGAPVVLVVSAHGDDYLLAAGGTLAGLVRQGAQAHLIRLTDEKDSSDAEGEQAARALGIREVRSLGYRSGELGTVSLTEIRDRLVFFLRHDRPSILFLPDPYAHYVDDPDHYYAGLAAEEAWWAAALGNVQPPHALAGLRPHRAAEVFYYAPPVDRERAGAESTAAFVPQPRSVDIRETFQRKLQAARALKTKHRELASQLRARLARTGRRLPLLDVVNETSVSRLVEIRLRGLGQVEHFHYAGLPYGVPPAYLLPVHAR